MVEDLESLIEKINQEGIQAAEEKAKTIEAEAKKRSEEIAAKAKKEAEKIIAKAKDDVATMEKSGEASLKQAGRNLIISLRKEIASVLDGIIKLNIREELTPAEMTKIISALVKNYKGQEKGNIVISLSKEDLEKMEKPLLGRLNSEVKKGITLKRSDDIQAGFIISYDSGRSHYDFTDKALAEYIGAYLKPKLSELLEGATASESQNK
jgi:V/A-type H+-transporting ATPase subunit E